MTLSDNSDEQDFPLLEALAKIKNIGDFRLTQFMRERGMNPTQPILFHRGVIKESKEAMSFIDSLIGEIFRLEETMSQFKAKLSSADQEIKRLRAEKNSLQYGSQQRIDNLEAENRQLKDIIAQLQEDANSHNLLKELLKGRMDSNTVQALYRLFYNTHMAQLADIGRQPPPDAGRLDKIEERLRQDFRDILRIPQEELEKEMDKLRAKNVELQKNNTALSLAYWALRQQGWVDTSRNETTEGEG